MAIPRRRPPPDPSLQQVPLINFSPSIYTLFTMEALLYNGPYRLLGL